MKPSYHVINDPIYGAMQFSKSDMALLKPFIDSAPFQRLRHVKQLGLTDLVFPGAVHTRFSHSLGCCYTARQIADKLGLSDDSRRLVSVAALLHDIGHGPFSHAFESIFHDKAICHEDWTPYFLQEFKSDSFCQQFFEQTGETLSPKFLQKVQALIMHQNKNRTVLDDIVSSQLDADRLDYLLRDSHFCGVAYGQYEIRWLLHCLMAIEVDGVERLGVSHKGIGVIEHYLMSRRLMTQNVYHHPKKYALEWLMQSFLQYVAKEMHVLRFGYNFVDSHLGQFLQAVNVFNQGTRDAKQKQAFLETQYRHYKQLNDVDISYLLRDLANSEQDFESVRLAKRIHTRQLPHVYPIAEDQVKALQEKITAYRLKKTIPPWQLTILHTPHEVYQADHDPIWVQYSHGPKQTMKEASMMIQAMSDVRETNYFVCLDKNVHAFKDELLNSC